MKVKSLRCVLLFATPWTVAQQTALSMGVSRKEYWNGLPFPPPGDLPDPGIEPTSPALQVDSFTTEPPGKPFYPVAAAAAKSLQSCRLLATPWTAAHQAPSSMGFSRQEYWSGVPLPSLLEGLNLKKKKKEP